MSASVLFVCKKNGGKSQMAAAKLPRRKRSLPREKPKLPLTNPRCGKDERP